ncbi:uncharacterized protein KY384_004772 [Bacidia gigantensis]|uniref:uncharacterized protein n=1 Tax=Bacidia gigantensis TaxID=2732470 RepID=UPI001D03F3A8|nr:uncharacterized protein KY384_004772 [Bacidia gigantensis]KAG8530271.1 hypothetical protein KY384_004772 [Bacidia gigantensis]
MGKTYYYSPNWSYPPGGSIDLGRIWTSPDDPRTNLTPLASSIPEVPPEEIQKGWKEGQKHETHPGRGGTLGLWAKFLEVFIGIERTENTTLQTRREDTWFFNPRPDDTTFLEAAVAEEAVQNFIIKNDYRKNVYMVTGVKISRAASGSHEESKRTELSMSAQGDGAPAGIPVSAGADLGLYSNNHTTSSFDDSSDFVFAYRMSKVYYEKADPLELRHKPHSKGAALSGLEDEMGEPAEIEEQLDTIKVLGLASQDTALGGSTLEKEVLVDETSGEECTVLIPNFY